MPQILLRINPVTADPNQKPKLSSASCDQRSRFEKKKLQNVNQLPRQQKKTVKPSEWKWRKLEENSKSATGHDVAYWHVT